MVQGPCSVSAIYIYPLKGARGISLESADVLASGLRHDRRFMLLDAKGTFITQREHPQMARVETAIEGDRLVLSIAGARAVVSLRPEEHAGRPRRTATVWKDDVLALDVGGEGAELLSHHLGERCSLMYLPPDADRQVELEYAREGDRVGFADAYPVLIASLASLADLNARLPSAVGIDRFRANIIVRGGEPWAEEAAHARVGAVSFRTPKRCSRCQVVTVDQHAGVVTGKEPLRTLSTFRKDGTKVYFAMNAIPDLAAAAAATSIQLGDPVHFA